MGKLDGKVVIVTGSSRGIGAEIARVFAAEGGKIVCAARTMHEGEHPLEGSLETTVAGIRKSGGEATPVAVDISQPEECEKLGRRGARGVRPDRRPGEQRGAHVLHPDQGLPGEPLAALVGRELPCAVHPEQALRWRT